MIDIAALGLSLCLAAGNIDCDKVSFEYDKQLKSDEVNGVTLLYTKSQHQVIKVSSEFKNNERITTNILIHELAHALVQQQGHSINHNFRHLKVYRETCKELIESLEHTDYKTCKKTVNYN